MPRNVHEDDLPVTLSKDHPLTPLVEGDEPQLPTDEAPSIRLVGPKSGAAPGTTDASADAINTAIYGWYQDYIVNSIVSQTTEAYNHLYQSLPALQAALEAALALPPP